MFSMMANALRKVFSISSETTNSDIVYFGGFEEAQLGENEVLFALYVPMPHGLVYLPYGAYEDEVIEQLRSLEIGEAFRVLEEDNNFDIGGTVTRIERIEPRQFIQIQGLETNHPEAPLYSVQRL